MKSQLVAIVEAVLLVGCGKSQEVKDKMLGEAAHSMEK
jgi:major membrane immunogen (membrane-anchored lipoprotein)